MSDLDELPEFRLKRRAALKTEYPDLDQFDDTTLEWRRLFAELFGTFMLVLVAAGGGMLHAEASDQVSLAAAVVAPGLMVMAIILFMGSVSGAHLNPVVSIAFALRSDFAWRRVPGYIPFDPEAANLMFMLISARYERASLIITSNKPFSSWGEIFGDEVVAAAMIDRLVHHAEILSMKGDSYRLKDRDLGRAKPSPI